MASCMLQLVEIDPTANRAHVLTSDGGKVIVALKATAFDSTFVEFEGIVDAPNQLREEARCEFGSSFGESSDLVSPQRLQAGDSSERLQSVSA